MKNKCSFIDKDGTRQEVTIGLEHYAQAKKHNLSLRQVVNKMYPTVSGGADTFTQMCQSVGMYVKPSRELGIKPITMAEVEYGGLDFSAGTQGTEVNPVQTKYLFPAVVAELVENKLYFDRGSAVAAFDQMLASVESVSGRRIEQPYIDYTRPNGPEDSRNMARAQGAEPATMMTIRAGEKSLTIPETPLAVTITDEALQGTTIDMVALAMARQAEVEMYTRAGEDLKKVLQGDVDAGSYGTAALAQVKVDTLDSTITTSGALTQTAWIKWLYTGIETRRINYVVTDIAGALAIENRAGRPTNVQENSNDRIDTRASIFYPNLVDSVQVYVVPTTAGWPVNTVMGFDSAYAMRKWINTLASYSDVERYVTRRASTYVVSFGSKVTRYFDDAFAVLSLTTT